ncbi:SLC13 family permease [Sungkyunkwania multivorans]|uniref:SLC13 family permease n=1 Tax=Sungkyunkwania multivorans TaxID=1173618 RepID=A0ABW3D1P8_9FLAO
MKVKKIGLISGPLIFLLTLGFFEHEALSAQGTAVLASTLWIAIWWLTEAIPIAATALLPLILFPLGGVMPITEMGASFSNQMIFLFLGGFIIATAIEKTNLHKRIALSIIYAIGSNWNRIILGFMVATGFLSMWISNTATAIMMLPIGLALVSQIKAENTVRSKMGQSLMFAIAYGCSIGGIATIIGTPTNPIFLGYVEQNYGITISFTQWMSVGLPFSVVMIILGWLYLTKVSFPSSNDELSGGLSTIGEQLRDLGKMSYQERTVSILFAIVAFLWIVRKSLIAPYIDGTSDALIAIAGAIALFIVPSGDRKRPYGITDWKNAETIPWGILLLFGGGLAIASGFKSSGLDIWIGNRMVAFGVFPSILLILAIITVVNFLTEITSNVATASMLMPVLGALAFTIDAHPFFLMTGATIAASCAFMLPVATAPNAIVFGSGLLTIKGMMKVGFWMNIISIILAALLVYFVLPKVWGIQIDVFPEIFK